MFFARLLAILCIGVLACAQDERSPKFQVNSRLVQVTVVAHDKDGGTVGDLTRDDLELLENSQRQPIGSFEVTTGNNAPTREFTSSQDRREPVRGPTVILLDWLNTSTANQMFARSQAIKALTALPPGEMIQLLELDPGRLHALHDFTADHAALVHALSAGEGRVLQPAGSNSAVDPSCPAVSGKWLSTDAIERLRLLRRRIDDTLNAFELIAAQLADVPGRKALIWVSGGFPLPACDSLSIHFDPAIQALRAANVAIYAVDARGLVPSPIRTKMGDEVADNAASMSIFTTRTGGRLYYNRNDVDAEILKAEDDLRVTYTLGYYIQSDRGEDTVRNVSVRSLRRGIDLSYWDSTPDKQRGEKASESGTSPLTVKMERNGDVLSAIIHVGPRSITLGENNGRWIGRAQLAAWFVLPDGRAAGDAVLKTIAADLTNENRAKLMANGFDYTLAVRIPEDAVTFKLKLSDSQNGQTGKLSVPVTLIPGHASGKAAP